MRPHQDLVDRPALIDPFGRCVDYLRLSVTDRCNFRCIYCMDPDTHFAPRAEVLSLEELLRTSQVFTRLGVKKIRITGGEPLVRSNVLWLLQGIAALPGLKELVLTTNGYRLEEMADALKAAGVSRLNISLDTLQPERFQQITRSSDYAAVMRGIDAALDAGFERVKLNSVIVQGRNHREVRDLAAFAVAKGADISFIEEMPVGPVEDHDRTESYYSSDQIKRDLGGVYDLEPVSDTTGGPSRYYRIPGAASRIGFISPRSHDFCASCNRVRVTVEGRLLLCLGQENSLDLKSLLRANPGDDDVLEAAIRGAILKKPRGHDFAETPHASPLRRMNVTGG